MSRIEDFLDEVADEAKLRYEKPDSGLGSTLDALIDEGRVGYGRQLGASAVQAATDAAAGVAASSAATFLRAPGASAAVAFNGETFDSFVDHISSMEQQESLQASQADSGAIRYIDVRAPRRRGIFKTLEAGHGGASPYDIAKQEAASRSAEETDQPLPDDPAQWPVTPRDVAMEGWAERMKVSKEQVAKARESSRALSKRMQEATPEEIQFAAEYAESAKHNPASQAVLDFASNWPNMAAAIAGQGANRFVPGAGGTLAFGFMAAQEENDFSTTAEAAGIPAEFYSEYARQYAVLSGAIEYSEQLINIAGLGGSAVKKAAKSMMGKAAKGAGEVMKNMVGEGTEEVTQQGLQYTLMAKMLADYAQKTGEGVDIEKAKKAGVPLKDDGSVDWTSPEAVKALARSMQAGAGVAAVSSTGGIALRAPGAAKARFYEARDREAKLGKKGLETLLEVDEAAAENLAGKEQPSRKDFEAMGLPRVSAKARAKAAAEMKQILKQKREAAEQPAAEEQEQPAPEEAPAAEEKPADEVDFDEAKRNLEEKKKKLDDKKAERRKTREELDEEEFGPAAQEEPFGPNDPVREELDELSWDDFRKRAGKAGVKSTGKRVDITQKVIEAEAKKKQADEAKMARQTELNKKGWNELRAEAKQAGVKVRGGKKQLVDDIIKKEGQQAKQEEPVAEKVAETEQAAEETKGPELVSHRGRLYPALPREKKTVDGKTVYESPRPDTSVYPVYEEEVDGKKVYVTSTDFEGLGKVWHEHGADLGKPGELPETSGYTKKELLAELGKKTAKKTPAAPKAKPIDVGNGFTLQQQDDGKYELTGPKGEKKTLDENDEADAALLDAAVSERRIPKVKENVEAVTKQMPGQKVTVVDTAKDLPDAVKKAAEDRGATADEVEGVWHDGQVYIVADNVRPQDVERIVLHETVGHQGVRSILGDKLNDVLGQIGSEKRLQGMLEDVAKDYGLDLNDSAQKAEAVEELLARIAESGPTENKTLKKKLVTKVRSWLRELGFVTKWSDQDILDLLVRARDSVTPQGAAAQGEFKFSLAAPYTESSNYAELREKHGDALDPVDTIRFSRKPKKFPVALSQLEKVNEMGRALSNVMGSEAQILDQLFPGLYPKGKNELNIVDTINLLQKAKKSGALADFMEGRTFKSGTVSWLGSQTEGTVPRTVDVEKFRSKSTKGLISGNIKTGISLDWALSSCVPTSGCPRCYAANIIQTNSSQQANFLRNLLWAMHDAKGMGDAVLSEMSKLRKVTKTSMKRLSGEHIRFNAYGDLGFSEQIDVINHVIAGMPEESIGIIFSRNHTARWKGQGALDQLVVPEGKHMVINASVDRQLVGEYGLKRLKQTPKDWNLSYLYVGDPKDMSTLKSLLEADMFPIVHMDIDDYNNLEVRGQLSKLYKDAGYSEETHTYAICPCSIRLQTQAASCVQCQAGCHGCFRTTDVDPTSTLIRSAAVSRIQVSIDKTRKQMKGTGKNIQLWDAAIAQPVAVVEKTKQGRARASKYLESLENLQKRLMTVDNKTTVKQASRIVTMSGKSVTRLSLKTQGLADLAAASAASKQPRGAAAGSMAASGEAVISDETDDDAETDDAETSESADENLSEQDIRQLPRFIDGIIKVIAPQLRSKQAGKAARVKRHRTAEAAQLDEALAHKINKLGKIFDRMTDQEQEDFIDRMEDESGPRPQATAELDAIAATLRQELDKARDRLQEFGLLEDFFQNYFPHILQHKDRSYDKKREIVSTRLLKPRSFTKKRKYPTMKDALAVMETDAQGNLKLDKDGNPIRVFERAFKNPVTEVLMRVHEMNRALSGYRMVQDLKEAGFGRFVPAHAEKDYTPQGHKVPKDPSFIVIGASSVDVKEAFDKLLAEQMWAIARSMGISHHRLAKMRGQVWGTSGPGKTIKTRFAGPLSVLAHEVGHQIQDMYNLHDYLMSGTHLIGRTHKSGAPVKKDIVANKSALAKELRALADLRAEGQPLTKSRQRYLRNKHEKMAAIMEAWLAAPEKMEKVAPLLTQGWKEFLAGNPDLEPLLHLNRSIVLGTASTTIKTAGVQTLGKWAFPEHITRILDNHLSRGISGSENYTASSMFEGVRRLRNVSLALSHGLSAFHGVNVGTDMINSYVSIGLQKLGRGDVVGALTYLGKAGLAPVEAMQAVVNKGQGHKLREALRQELDTITDPLMRIAAEAVIKAGGRSEMPSLYKSDAASRVRENLRSMRQPENTADAVKNGAALAVNTLLATVEATAIPIMQNEVPNLKLGVFYHMAQDIYKQANKKGWNDDQIQRKLVSAWDSMDNRMGELVYDNLNLNRTLKELMIVLFRAPGWTLGSLREFGGAAIDTAATPFRIAAKATGKDIEVGGVTLGAADSELITSKMGYSTGAALSYSIQGIILTKLLSGRFPWEWWDDDEDEPTLATRLKDLYFPRTGRKNDDGSDERLQLPHYTKDIVHWLSHPAKTISNKLNPLWGSLLDIKRNEDYFGTEIRSNPLYTPRGLAESAEYFVKNMFMPFSVRNAFKYYDNGSTAPYAITVGLSGISPAPAAIARTPAQELMIKLAREGGVKSKRNKQEQEEREDRRKMIKALRSGKKVDMSHLNSRQQDYVKKQAAMTPFQSSFERLSFDNAVKVFNIANSKERRETWSTKQLKAGGEEFTYGGLTGKKSRQDNAKPDTLRMYYELQLTQDQIDQREKSDIAEIGSVIFSLADEKLSDLRVKEQIRRLEANPQYDKDPEQVLAAFANRWTNSKSGKWTGRRVGTPGYFSRLRVLNERLDLEE